MNDFIKKWKNIVSKANDKGIPLPMVRDPDTLEGSVSLTLVIISSFLVSAGIIGKWGGFLGGIDINNALQFFYASCGLYFGRKWGSKTPLKGGLPDAQDKDPAPDSPDDPDVK